MLAGERKSQQHQQWVKGTICWTLASASELMVMKIGCELCIALFAVAFLWQLFFSHMHSFSDPSFLGYKLCNAHLPYGSWVVELRRRRQRPEIWGILWEGRGKKKLVMLFKTTLMWRICTEMALLSLPSFPEWENCCYCVFESLFFNYTEMAQQMLYAQNNASVKRHTGPSGGLGAWKLAKTAASNTAIPWRNIEHGINSRQLRQAHYFLVR